MLHLPLTVSFSGMTSASSKQQLAKSGQQILGGQQELLRGPHFEQATQTTCTTTVPRKGLLPHAKSPQPMGWLRKKWIKVPLC